LSSLVANRDLSLLHVAIYDAIVAAWESKHAYNRPRPSAFDSTLSTPGASSQRVAHLGRNPLPQ
jgi:hypothetical protein